MSFNSATVTIKWRRFWVRWTYFEEQDLYVSTNLSLFWIVIARSLHVIRPVFKNKSLTWSICFEGQEVSAINLVWRARALIFNRPVLKSDNFKRPTYFGEQDLYVPINLSLFCQPVLNSKSFTCQSTCHCFEGQEANDVVTVIDLFEERDLYAPINLSVLKSKSKSQQRMCLKTSKFFCSFEDEELPSVFNPIVEFRV